MASVEIKYKDSRRISKSSRSLETASNKLASLKCMYLNATSLVNKLDEFKVVLNTYHPEIVAVSETWFRGDLIADVPGYKIYRKDRSDGRNGGGVCIYIKDSIDSYELVDGGFNLSKIEQIWAVIYFGHEKY